MKRSRISRAVSIVLLSAIILGSSLTGCSGSSNTSAASSGASAGTSAGASSDASKKVTITIMTRWVGSADSYTPIFKKIEEDFMKQNPNIVIQDNSISEENSYNNKLKTEIATGTPPDIFYFPGVAGLASWAKNGVIMDISDLIKNDTAWSGGFIDGAFDTWQLEKYGVKGIYAMPYAFSPEVMYYNKTLFKKAGIASAPVTMDDMYAAIKKLQAINVIPWSCGAKDNWRSGHIYNNIVYKAIGVEGLKGLGTRQKKYTDADVVASLQVMKDLKAAGAFEKGFEGIDFNSESAEFTTGKAAMMCNGSWYIANINTLPNKSDYSFFTFPYLSDKTQYKDNNVLFNQAFCLSNTMKGEEKDAAIKFMKYFTGKEVQTRNLKEGNQFPARKDVDTTGLDPLSADMVSYIKTIKTPGGDIFDYDPDTAMIDVQRSAIVNMMLGDTAAACAQNIQKEVDTYVKTNK